MKANTVVTMVYNLWGDHRWEDRAGPLRELLRIRDPDILATQELRLASRTVIDEVLQGHDRVEDDFPGWAGQGNIWWRRDLFKHEDHGAEDIGIRADDACLFWVRLAVRDLGTSLVFATAHYTWPGHETEWHDDVSPRPEHARRTVDALNRLAPDIPCIFTGDLNDYARPLWILRSAGFEDSFSYLKRLSPATHPVFPNPVARVDVNDPEFTPSTIDWQFHRGPLAPRVSEVVDFYSDGVPPSDHKPVAVAYRIERGPEGLSSDLQK
ncbi:endonuclease/exonuclease/phosphatase family protein [Phytoactinopolyspora endophytica]|uniref:endonuclease/exonuclease/phosphatase family protein n=1 Tax=Phytoactinopolyspora endophytica TaxID=1642495 RepID=UPI00197C88ED|nr:endonuclease/exonuclease/phosphatase family protein [Phytoactinopolyspora endophytica]